MLCCNQDRKSSKNQCVFIELEINNLALITAELMGGFPNYTLRLEFIELCF